MAINYAKAARVALRFITKNGRPVQIVKLSTQVADLNKPWRGSEDLPDTTITVTAVFIDLVSAKAFGMAEVVDPETGVKMGTRFALIAANENLDDDGEPIDISEYHRMIDGGRTYKMGKIYTLSPGATPLMYTVELER